MIGVVAYLIFFLSQGLIFAVCCLGLNLQWGNTGLFNVGVSGFYLIGAYTFALLCAPAGSVLLGGFGMPFIVGIIGSMVVTGIAAFIIGVATLRLRADYLAIATIGVAISLRLVALNTTSLTGGAQGFPNVPRPFGGLIQNNFDANLAFFGLMVVIVAVIYFGLEAMVRSPWGRVLRAIREDEPAAASLGKSPFSYRMQSFVIGSALIGLGGAMFASFLGFLSSDNFFSIMTFQVWTMLIIGGSGNNKGAILGAILIWAVWTATGSVAQAVLPTTMQVKGGALQIIFIGLILMLVLLFRPRGILGEEASVSRAVPKGLKKILQKGS
ncbi:MAG TPA: branched-chain amino acid ABC transporter permease [Nevskiaceae bacterium]